MSIKTSEKHLEELLNILESDKDITDEEFKRLNEVIDNDVGPIDKKILYQLKINAQLSYKILKELKK